AIRSKAARDARQGLPYRLCSQRNAGFGADSGPFRGDTCRLTFRPAETFLAAPTDDRRRPEADLRLDGFCDVADERAERGGLVRSDLARLRGLRENGRRCNQATYAADTRCALPPCHRLAH